MSAFCFGCMRQKCQVLICEHCGFDDRVENLPHQLPQGTLLNGQYLIGRVLGQGGFGITYMGWDQHLSLPVAIKEYYPSSMVQRNCVWGLSVSCGNGLTPEQYSSQTDRFIKEARTLAQLSAIGEIVQVKNYFSENGTAYIVMEYVQGKTLKAHLKELGRPMTPQEVLDLMEPVLTALHKVHGSHMIHRDISPDNIMICEDGGIKLIDFGTVRDLDSSHSRSTESVLKPGFAPIEQYNSRGRVGPWTDVYAICATIYYLLTGKLPPDAPTRVEDGDTLPLLDQIPGIKILFGQHWYRDWLYGLLTGPSPLKRFMKRFIIL